MKQPTLPSFLSAPGTWGVPLPSPQPLHCTSARGREQERKSRVPGLTPHTHPLSPGAKGGPLGWGGDSPAGAGVTPRCVPHPEGDQTPTWPSAFPCVGFDLCSLHPTRAKPSRPPPAPPALEGSSRSPEGRPLWLQAAFPSSGASARPWTGLARPLGSPRPSEPPPFLHEMGPRGREGVGSYRLTS